MNEEVRDALEKEVLRQLQELESLNSGSKEQQTAVENVAKLYRLGIDEMKVDTEYEEKIERRRMDSEREENNLNQEKEQKKDRYVKYGFEAAKMILPMAFYAVWMKKGFKFEETGTYTSTTFRGLFSKFRPTS